MYEVHHETIIFPTMVSKVKHINCGRRILIQLQSLRDYLEAGDPPTSTPPDQSGAIRKIAL